MSKGNQEAKNKAIYNKIKETLKGISHITNQSKDDNVEKLLLALNSDYNKKSKNSSNIQDILEKMRKFLLEEKEKTILDMRDYQNTVHLIDSYIKEFSTMTMQSQTLSIQILLSLQMTYHNLMETKELVDMLYEIEFQKCDPYDTKNIWEAAKNGQVLAVKYWYHQYPELLEEYDFGRKFYTPLQLATMSGDLDCIKFLVENKADVNKASAHTHMSPLQEACFIGRRDIVLYLLEAGANIQHLDVMKESSLHWAVRGGNPEVVELLVLNQINLKQKNRQDRTALDLARLLNNLDIVALLEK